MLGLIQKKKKKNEENDLECVRAKKNKDNFYSRETYTQEEKNRVFSKEKVFGRYNHE